MQKRSGIVPTDKELPATTHPQATDRTERLLKSVAFIISMDARGHVRDCNQACERLFGLTSKLAENLSFAELVGSTSDSPDLINALHRIAQTHEPFVRWMRWQTAAGGVRDVMVRFSCIGGDNTDNLEIIAVGLDVSGWHGTEDIESHSTDQTTRASAEIPSTVVISTIDDGRLVEVNDGFCAMLGYARDEVIGRTGLELGLLDSSSTRQANMEVLRRKGKISNQPVVLRTRLGKPMKCVFSAEIITLGSTQYLLSTFHDAEKQSQAEQRLSRTEAPEALGRLAEGLETDYNNALSLIQGRGALLIPRRDLPNDFAASIREVLERSTTPSDLARELIRFGGEQKIELTETTLGAIVAQCRPELERAAGKGVELEIRSFPERACVTLNSTLMKRAIGDIVALGARLESGSGIITIETDQTATRHLRNARTDAPLTSVIKVTCHGARLPDAHLRRLFDPASPTENGVDNREWDLSVTHAIVAQSGGWIDVASGETFGTCLTVCLPIPEPESHDGQTPTAQSAESGPGRFAIVAESREAVRNIIGVSFKRCGYRPLLANNAREALALWAQHEDGIKFLFTDMVLPGGMGGRELANQMREKKPGLKVIFSSGYGTAFINSDILEDPHSRFLPKPFGFEQLRTALNCMLTPGAASEPIDEAACVPEGTIRQEANKNP